MAQGPIIQYDAYIISPGTDLTLTGVGTPSLTASYGDYGRNFETGKKADCTIYINYTNVQSVINSDNSITVSGRINGAILRRTSTGIPATGDQTIKASFNGRETFSTIVPTGSSGTYDLNIPNTFSVTVPPSTNPQPTYVASIDYYNAVTNSLSPDRFFFGMIITNPNPPDYRPGAILVGGKWLSHDRSGGEAHILANGRWKEMRTSDGGVGSTNPPSIRKNNKWVNQRKIGKE